MPAGRHRRADGGVETHDARAGEHEGVAVALTNRQQVLPDATVGRHPGVAVVGNHLAGERLQHFRLEIDRPRDHQPRRLPHAVADPVRLGNAAPRGRGRLGAPRFIVELFMRADAFVP